MMISIINKKYLPSKKFIMALSVALAIILVAMIFNYWKINTVKYKNNNLTFGINANSSVIDNTDSDNDGLPDWKEGLYGTNPKKADTDKDGTSDFDEISQNRDPLKPNIAPAGQEPNDKIDPAIIEKNQKAMEEYEKLNETDKFSRDLISNIIASQPASGSMDQDTVNSILAKAMEEIPQKNYAGITKDTDLNLLKTDAANLDKNMKEYATKFYAEMGKLMPILGNDMNIIDSYISGDTKAGSEMLKLTDKYQIIVNDLVKMPVPVAIGYYDINYHLTVINDLEKIIAVDRDIVNSGKNSLSIFSNLSIYNSVAKNLISTLITIDGILKTKR